MTARLCRLLSIVLSLIFAGCISMPEPAYKKGVRDTPAFREAVAVETQRELERGRSPEKVGAIAVRTATQQSFATERERRTQLVAPLVKALEAFERPSGCWAYTTTTTTRRDDRTTVDVARFDAFQPEDRLWTLISRDGVAPDDETQASFRRTKLKAWKKQLARKPTKYSKAELIEGSAIMRDLQISEPDPAGRTTFTLSRGHAHITGLADIPASRTTYTIGGEGKGMVTRQTMMNLEPASMLGGSLKMERWEMSTDYLLIEPTAPPFPAKTEVRFQIKFLGNDSGDFRVETVYSDYRRVKCYDDRFGVSIGEPSMSDFLPAGN